MIDDSYDYWAKQRYYYGPSKSMSGWWEVMDRWNEHKNLAHRTTKEQVKIIAYLLNGDNNYAKELINTYMIDG